jgi:hypothetical protein
MKLSLLPKLMVFLFPTLTPPCPPSLNVNVLFAGFLQRISHVYDQTQGSGTVFSYFTNNFNIVPMKLYRTLLINTL